MNFPRFALERWQSTYENSVEYNLSESGVHPLTVGELGIPQENLAKCRLGYGVSNGTERFRSLVASLYKGATERNVLATIGAAEANLISILRLLEPGDEVAIVLPNYMQTYGLIQALGGRIVPIWLRPEKEWLPDPEEIASRIGPKTKLITFCNPNNPTGSVFGRATINALAAVADRYGSWILADEVYRGAERIGEETPSFWGEYPKTIITGSLSKAYGTPGLRLGWVLASEETIEEVWSYADYTKIAPPALSDLVGCRVLEQRDRILERTRRLLNQNWPNLKNWLDSRPGLFEYVPPKAAAICMTRYHARINSSVLAERLRVERSTLIVPGDQFLLDGYIRFGFGNEASYLLAGLQRVGEMLDSVR
ncbi:MAG: aspartate aminotransferase [Acidobacteria bacterium]|nr:MAG: aspartate aminotransferase [Acidobacteriota bacterium]